MGPAVVAYQLLQPVKSDVRAQPSGFDPRSATRAATLFAFCASW
jgi:hypothetical protein